MYRRIFYKLVPPWLTSGDGELVLYSIGLMLDAFTERARQGLDARFPSRTGASALALIGAERGIPRGRTELAEHYAARLTAWRNPRGHRARGSAYALLEQISEYWGGALQCGTVNNRGRWHIRDAAGALTHGDFPAWSWDGDAASWSRFWIILQPAPAVGIAPWGPLLGAWGNSLQPGNGHTLGQSGVTPEDVAAMRRLLVAPIAWKPAGTQTDYAVIDVAGGTPIEPLGLWGTLRGRVANAPAGLRFWRLGR
jgi:hypothetical protein